MNTKNFLFLFLLILVPALAVAEKSVIREHIIEPEIIEDVRRVETQVANLFGYAQWPLSPTKVTYNTNCKSPASYYSNGTIMFSCDIGEYRTGKPFVKKNAFGETETFPGYVDYFDTVAHEVGHSFSRVFIDLNDQHWGKCDADEYLELSEGFATYVAYEILLRESKTKNDYQYERYLAARTVRYLTQLRMGDKKSHHSLSRVSSTIAAVFSPESEQYINAHMKYFSDKEIFALKDKDLVVDWYPHGLMRVYALKHIFTKEGFENGGVKKYFCK